MISKGWPWDSTDNDPREYGAQEVADAFSSFISNGIVDATSGFIVTPTSPPSKYVTISPGTAWINGHMLRLDGEEQVEIPWIKGSSSSSSGNGLILRCRSDADHRDFEVAVTEDAIPNLNPSDYLAENEVLLALVQVERPSQEMTADKISATGRVSATTSMATGRWLPTINDPDITIGGTNASWAKVGEITTVYCKIRVGVYAAAESSDPIQIDGLPIAPHATGRGVGMIYATSGFPIASFCPVGFSGAAGTQGADGGFVMYKIASDGKVQPFTRQDFGQEGSYYIEICAQFGGTTWQ